MTSHPQAYNPTTLHGESNISASCFLVNFWLEVLSRILYGSVKQFIPLPYYMGREASVIACGYIDLISAGLCKALEEPQF